MCYGIAPPTRTKRPTVVCSLTVGGPKAFDWSNEFILGVGLLLPCSLALKFKNLHCFEMTNLNLVFRLDGRRLSEFGSLISISLVG